MKKSLLLTLFLFLNFNTFSFDGEKYQEMFKSILNGEYNIDLIENIHLWDEFLFMDGVYGGFNQLHDTMSNKGDGNVVGNGGGISEGTFEYSFQILGRVINDCLNDHYCLDEEHEYQQLEKIKDVFYTNITMTNYLIFVDGEVHKNFFEEVNGRGPRTAMTGSKPLTPVFINTSHLYDKLGTPRWNVGKSIAILIHELGHQTGNGDHRYLDKIGQKVKRFLEADKVTLENKFDDEIIRVWMRNGTNPEAQFEFGVFWDGKELNLRENVLNNIKCPRGFDLDTYSFSNLHWDHLRHDDKDGYIVPITLWLNLRCIDLEKGLVAESDALEYKILLSKDKNQELKVGYFVERL